MQYIDVSLPGHAVPAMSQCHHLHSKEQLFLTATMSSRVLHPLYQVFSAITPNDTVLSSASCQNPLTGESA